MNNIRHKNKGVALITSLLIVALVVATVTALFLFQEVSIRRTQQVITADQAYLYAQGVESWAVGVLQKDIFSGNMVNWPKLLPQTSIPGGVIFGKIIDLQSRFNLNLLRDEENSIYFTKLLRQVDSTLSEEKAYGIADAVAVWVSSEGTVDDQLEDYELVYGSYSPPYRPGHQFMASVSELRLIKGMTPKLYLALQPYITVLPAFRTKININTVSGKVLSSYIVGMSEAEVASLLEQRETVGGFTSVEEFLELIPGEAYNLVKDQITIESFYFLCRADVRLENQHFVMYSILNRQESSNGRPADVGMYWQSRGTL